MYVYISSKYINNISDLDLLIFHLKATAISVNL